MPLKVPRLSLTFKNKKILTVAEGVKGGKNQLQGKVLEWKNSKKQIVDRRTKSLGGMIVGEDIKRQLIKGEIG